MVTRRWRCRRRSVLCLVAVVSVAALLGWLLTTHNTVPATVARTAAVAVGEATSLSLVPPDGVVGVAADAAEHDGNGSSGRSGLASHLPSPPRLVPALDQLDDPSIASPPTRAADAAAADVSWGGSGADGADGYGAAAAGGGGGAANAGSGAGDVGDDVTQRPADHLQWQQLLENGRWRDGQPSHSPSLSPSTVAPATTTSLNTTSVAASHGDACQMTSVPFSVNWPDAANTTCISSSATSTRLVHLGVIFTRASHSMCANLRRMLRSVAAHTSACVHVHFIVDNTSRQAAESVFHSLPPHNNFAMSLYDIDVVARPVRPLLAVLRQYFAPQQGAYYDNVLFFITLTLHQAPPLPHHVHRLIMLDIDVSVRADIARLDQLFDRFAPDQVMAMSYEQSPVYHYVLRHFRRRYPTSRAGLPSSPAGADASAAGFPGFNSGVLLLHLQRMRTSSDYRALLDSDQLRRLATLAAFKGHLGDQDVYTLLALDERARRLFAVLPCTWNRQLCRYWSRVPGYRRLFAAYFSCPGTVHIYHGNCRTPLPADTL